MNLRLEAQLQLLRLSLIIEILILKCSQLLLEGGNAMQSHVELQQACCIVK